MNAKCKVCGGKDAKRCSNCFTVAYCSKDCQKNDWNSHMRACKKRKSELQVLKEWRQVPGFASEYRTKYPLEEDQFDQLKEWEDHFKEQVSLDCKIDFNFDLAYDKWRWDNLDANGQKIFRLFKKLPRMGDAVDFTYEMNWTEADFNNGELDAQIFSERPDPRQVYDFSNTYVGVGFVDLWQLMDGIYLRVNEGVLKFYGFDACELVVARALLVLEMMKAPFEEICSKTILQVWFSSCLDDQTKLQVTSFLKKNLTCHNPLLKKYAKVWLEKITKVSVEDAQDNFCFEPEYLFPLLNLKKENDRVKFTRYLNTGCVFVNEDKVVCGNPTMYPLEMDDYWYHPSGSIFAFINLSKVERNAYSLIDNILRHIKYKFTSFRTLVQNGKIECSLEVKFVEANDETFADRLRKLNPSTIHWSDLADNWNRHDFLEFAQKCSGPDTQHFFQLRDWNEHVFGSNWIDLTLTEKDSQSLLDNLRKEWKEETELLVLANAENSAQSSLKVPLLVADPKDAANQHLELKYAEKYFNFFLTDRKGHPIKRKFIRMPEHDCPFARVSCSLMGYFTFSFNRNLNMNGVN